MLKTENLLEKMKGHFPRWMDIRKRTDKSVGGKLLTSIAEEFAEGIQQAIDDYKKDFFIDKYEGKEDEVIAFLYKAHIGILELQQIELTNPELDITEDRQEFYNSTNKAYYENGYVFIKTEDVENEVLQYSIDGYPTTGQLEKIHVWNVFDEFAAFTGLKRYEWEKNSELTKRILNVGRRKPDSTDEGLKNAILNALTNIDQNLEADEIKIEPPTPENLLKYYKEFDSVIEKMAQTNRDIYRTKRWDVDNWQHPFASIDYMPHAWDVLIDSYKNGVGFEDDLKVVLTNANDTTDTVIKLYTESDVTAHEYIKSNNIKKKIDLKLKRFNNVIKPITVKYKITASEAKDITAENISMTVSQVMKGEEERYIQSIILDKHDVEEVPKNALTDNIKYKLIFKPKSDFGYMSIEKCTVNNVSILPKTLDPSSAFMYNEAGVLQSKNTKVYITRTHQFSKVENAINTAEGITMDVIDREAILELPLVGVHNELMYIDYSCGKASVPRNLIYLNNCVYDTNGEIYSTPNMGDSVEFTVEANEVSFSINGGCNIITTVNGIQDSSMIFNKDGYTYFSTPKTMTPRTINIKLISSSNGFPMRIKDLSYNNFSIVKSLDSNQYSLVDLAEGTRLPAADATLVLRMSTKTQYVPTLKFIHIGTKLTGVQYELTINPGVKRVVDVSTNCTMTLQELDSSNAVVKTINNYEPYLEYKALSDQAYIKLNMSSYSSISEMKTFVGKFETIGTGNFINYYLRLNKDNTVSKITVNGERLISKITKSLSDVLQTTASDKIIANKLLGGIVIQKDDGSQVLKKIGSATLANFGGEHISVSGIPDYLECAFLVDPIKNTLAVGNSYLGEFASLYLYPKNSSTYIAFNESRLIKSEVSGVEIVDVFNPFIPENQRMVYLVEPLDPSHMVRFNVSDDFVGRLPNWSFEANKLRVAAEIEFSNQSSYDFDTKNIEKEYPLRNVIPLDATYVLPNGEVVNLAEFEISSPEGTEVVYKSITMLSNNEMEQFGNDYKYSESFIPEDDGFNKLRYAIIDAIEYVGTKPYSDNPAETAPIPTTDYDILTEGGVKKGIIIWNTPKYSDLNQVIYVKYRFKKPDYLRINSAELYKAAEYAIDAYKEILSVDLKKQRDGDSYDISKLEEFKNAKRITVACSAPGFEAMISDGKITFTKPVLNNSIAVKTGFYYIDGEEYYMFANSNIETMDKFKNVQMFSVDRENGVMLLSKESNNYVKNSSMKVDNLAEIYNVDFQSKDISGISQLNSITACNSFNHWESFGAETRLMPGYNGLGLYVMPTVDNGYVYLDITEYLLPTTELSFYMEEGMKAFIGKERKVFGLELNKATSIDLQFEVLKSSIEDNIYECKFQPEAGYKYYLIVKNMGVIDDIILQDGSSGAVYKDLHKKNLTQLKFDIEETIMNDYKCRIFLDDNRGAYCDGAEVNRDDAIAGSSLIDWGITRIKRFDDMQSWSRCVLDKVDNNNGVISTLYRKPGSIETEPIYIGDVRTIKNFIFKINDVMFDNMKGFSTKILINEKYSGNYRVVSNNKENVGYISGKYLAPYVKLLIEMPGEKVIDNVEVFVEYKSTENAAPVEILVPNGTFISKIFDARYSANYKLESIAVDYVSNINDVAIQIRGARDGYDGEVWTTWKDVRIGGDLSLLSNITFNNYRYFQVKVTLKNKDAFIKLKHLDLGVI